jgi:hypothetical protein
VQVHEFHLAVGIGFQEDLLEMTTRRVFGYVQFARYAGNRMPCDDERAHAGLRRTQAELACERAIDVIVLRARIECANDGETANFAKLGAKCRARWRSTDGRVDTSGWRGILRRAW